MAISNEQFAVARTPSILNWWVRVSVLGARQFIQVAFGNIFTFISCELSAQI